LYSNDVKKRCDVYIKSGMLPLAYTLAKSNNLNDYAAQILEDAGVSEKDVELPELGDAVPLPQPIAEPVTNWPLKESSLSYFETALLTGKVENLSLEDDVAKEVTTNANDVSLQYDEEVEDGEEEGDAWDIDEELDIGDDDDDDGIIGEDSTATVATAATLENEIGDWLRNAKTPATYVAAGALGQAALLLNKQVGVSNFEPLRQRFLQVYGASKLYLPGVTDLPAMKTYIREDTDEEDPKKFRPIVPGYDTLEEQLQLAFKKFKANNLEDAIKTFRSVIYTITVLNVDDEAAETKCQEVLVLCREYILGLSIELARRALPPTDVKRNLELASYFTKVQLQPAHKLNALNVAMTQSFKNKNFASASYFAEEFLKISSTGPRAEQAMKLKAKADAVASDSVEIDFDPFAEFTICCGSFTPIYNGEPSVTEALVGATYKSQFKGSVCKITEVTTVGVPASGLRIRT